MIFEREQQGKRRAQYGAKLIEGLAEYLPGQYGKGFSVVNLKNMRMFFQIYAPSIGQAVPAQLPISDSPDGMLGTPLRIGQALPAQFKLSWTHYQVLIRVEHNDARRFYEIEAINQHWSYRQLRRQVASSLYERLALSRDKDKVMALGEQRADFGEPPRHVQNAVCAGIHGARGTHGIQRDGTGLSPDRQPAKVYARTGQGFFVRGAAETVLV